jgi:hypothetical protein
MNVQSGVELRINLPKVYTTINKAKRIARLKIIKDRLIGKTFFGFYITNLFIFKNQSNPIEFKFNFVVVCDNEIVSKEEYNSFVSEINKIVDAIENKMK